MKQYLKDKPTKWGFKLWALLRDVWILLLHHGLRWQGRRPEEAWTCDRLGSVCARC